MSNSEQSVWHAGERELQRRLGVAERMAEVGPRVLNPLLPEQHRAVKQTKHQRYGKKWWH